ncbi:MAG: hypothetical protein HDQ98_01465 [Lachnospiraceae bacterium]|nr:hypothetical protein [Lachnospiraceae bacterium]
MEIVFTNPGVDYMIHQIMEFQGEEETAFWSDSLYHFFPQLDRAHTTTLSFAEKKKYIDGVLRKVYVELEDTINEKTVLYSQHWKNCKARISEALSEAFEVDCSTLFNDLHCNVSMNPVGPRFLREHSFDVFYLNSERGAIGSSIHEIIHFVWFYVWNDLFGDSYDEYERPSLKWILSEMVVESVMKDPRLSDINPYFPRENGGCIYPYFFDMVVNDSLILDTLDEMYRSRNIREFMKTSYAYCQQHEVEIRNHIQKSENK